MQSASRGTGSVSRCKAALKPLGWIQWYRALLLVEILRVQAAPQSGPECKVGQFRYFSMAVGTQVHRDTGPNPTHLETWMRATEDVPFPEPDTWGEVTNTGLATWPANRLLGPYSGLLHGSRNQLALRLYLTPWIPRWPLCVLFSRGPLRTPYIAFSVPYYLEVRNGITIYDISHLVCLLTKVKVVVWTL
jgi:hypothetical protein